MPRLVVHRSKSLWQDRARDYKVLVDGKEAGKVGSNCESTIELEPGTHTVRLQIDWCHSPEIRVSASPGEAIHLECGPNATPFLVLFYVTVWKDRYMWLRKVRRG